MKRGFIFCVMKSCRQRVGEVEGTSNSMQLEVGSSREYYFPITPFAYNTPVGSSCFIKPQPFGYTLQYNPYPTSLYNSSIHSLFPLLRRFLQWLLVGQWIIIMVVLGFSLRILFDEPYVRLVTRTILIVHNQILLNWVEFVRRVWFGLPQKASYQWREYSLFADVGLSSSNTSP